MDSTAEEEDQAHELELVGDPIQHQFPMQVGEDLVEVAAIEQLPIAVRQVHGGQRVGMLEGGHLEVRGHCLGWAHHWRFVRSGAIAGEP